MKILIFAILLKTIFVLGFNTQFEAFIKRIDILTQCSEDDWPTPVFLSLPNSGNS